MGSVEHLDLLKMGSSIFEESKLEGTDVLFLIAASYEIFNEFHSFS